MALINLTLMLLLTCSIGKSNLLLVSEGPNQEDNYLSNNEKFADKSIILTKVSPPIGVLHILPEFNQFETVTQNHQVNDDQIDYISGSGLVLEQQYRNPKFAMESINPKDQVEDLQSDDTVESDVMLEEQFRHSKYSIEEQNEIFDADIEVNSRELNKSHEVTVFACILAMLSVGVICAFISWRSYIRKQFGRSHRLVPSDEPL